MSGAGATTAARPAPYVSTAPAGSDGFGAVLRSEWTKLRTVPGWVAGLVVAGLITLLLGLTAASGGSTSCSGGPGGPGAGGDQTSGGAASGGGPGRCGAGSPPVGPGGEAVTDHFQFVHQPLRGDGTITVRVTGLTGESQGGAGTEPWTKAGLIVKDGTAQGSSYAAVMVTGAHGVRMQHDYVHDTAGTSATVTTASPHWLRLTRSGDTITGFESADGSRWTEVGTARLDGLPDTAEVGLFVASPEHQETELGFGSAVTTGGPTAAEATFDGVALGDGWSASDWRADAIGGDDGPLTRFEQAGSQFTLAGSGDIAPKTNGPGAVERSLVGVFAGLIAVIVVGALFVTAEYRRGLVRTTFAASPRRGRVLAAKAVVLGGVTFAVGLAAALLSLWLVGALRRQRGETLIPIPVSTEVRMVVGTAVLLALAAVLALAVGAILRRGGGAVAAAIVLVVLPYLLAVSSAVPLDVAWWLLRVTPAAAFAVQQGIPEYAHVLGDYSPPNGYYPLPWWGGLGVLVLWTVAALALATVLVRRRDA